MRSLTLVFLSLYLWSSTLAAGGITQERKEIARAVAQLDQALKNKAFGKAFNSMTDEAKDGFVAQTLMTCLDIANYAEPKLAAKFAAVCKSIGISEKLLPSAFITGEGISSEEEFLALQAKAEKNLLKAVGDDASVLKALMIIFTAAEGIPADAGFFPFNPFEGEMGDITTTPDGVTARLEGAMEPSFHQFVRQETQWKWNGIDEEMYMEWLDQPLPLIDDIKITGKTINGETIHLADFRGKIVLVDFWGTWCGPCVAELPTLKKIYQALHDQGFEILGVAQDDQRTLKSFLSKRHLPWANIVDAQGTKAAKFKINAFPTTLLINAQGNHYASDLAGTELLDELIEQLDLNAKDYKSLRSEIEESESDLHYGGPDEATPAADSASGMLPVGFEAADSDANDAVSEQELREYLTARLPDELPTDEIFHELDQDGSGSLSSEEFDNRHEVIEGIMGLGYLSGMEPPADPGSDFVPLPSLNSPVDDRKIFGAVFHRYYETAEAQSNWKPADLSSIPETCSLAVPSNSKSSSLETLFKSALILAGGGDQMFAAGAVAISEDGLALTNYHVGEALQSSKLFALRHDGESFPVAEMVAGNRDRDVAIIRIAGTGFTPVAIAQTAPIPGDTLEMVHHSENRFYTYDRGYLMRHPMIGEHPWMEVSMDYAPGGSGCGIFNERRELVGLVSTIQFGDGPSIAEPFTDWDPEDGSAPPDHNHANSEGYGGESYGEGEFQDEALIMVKQAVSLDSIRSLFSVSISK
ncbi:MAG: redoxin domain-containing protein [Aureliella sp.]